MTGDAREVVARLRQQVDAATSSIPRTLLPEVLTADVATLLAEHDRLAAADPVAVMASVDLEQVLAGHRPIGWGTRTIDCSCGWTGDYTAGIAVHQAERARAALTEALGGGAT